MTTNNIITDIVHLFFFVTFLSFLQNFDFHNPKASSIFVSFLNDLYSKDSVDFGPSYFIIKASLEC